MTLDLHKHSEMGKLPTPIIDQNWTMIEGAFNVLEQTFYAQLPPSNLTADRDPTPDDDYTQGWREWTKWFRPDTNTIWVLLDPKPGEALWWKTPFDPSGFGSASMADLGTAPDNVPQNSDLGSAAYRVVGTDPLNIVDITIGDARYMSAEETLATLGAGDAVAFNEAGPADIFTGEPDTLLSSESVRAAHGSAALVDGAVIAIDCDNGINHHVTIASGSTREIGSPTNAVPRAYYTVLVQGASSTPSAITFSADYGGELPAGLDDISNTRWYLLTIVCIAPDHFAVTAMDVSPP